ncbi:hypothetical protein EI53_00723 [Fusobacterium naviforme]|nr:hypothetical protein EI53_00723 [Fusobacterium naviforme]STO27171.1 Integrase [Fusobacterium naviforme]
MSLFMQGISGSDMTVVELAERYISLKSGVKQSTVANYKTVINNLKKTEFAYRHVDQVKLSDAKMFLISLQRNGLGYSSIHNIRGVLRPAFQMAVDDDLILKWVQSLTTTATSEKQFHHRMKRDFLSL